MVFTEWIIWTVAFIFSLGWLMNLRNDARTKKPIHMVTIVQTTMHFSALILFVFLPWSKLNLLWVIPSGLLLAYPVGFLLMRVAILGTALRIIFLLFARLYLVGIGGDIRGAPYSK